MLFFFAAINEALRHEVESLKIANAELRTPTEPSLLTSRRVPYSPTTASPSTLTPQPPTQYFSPLPSPSAVQPPTQYTSPLTSPPTVQLPVHYTTPLTSPSTVQLPVHYSPLTSPSTVQNVHFSPLNSPSLAQTAPFTQAASPSPSTSRATINFSPTPKPSVYAVAPLPPLHRSRSSIISRRLRQANVETPSQKNDSPSGSNKEQTIVTDEGAPVYSNGSDGTGSASP